MTAATKEFMEQHVRTDPRYADFPASMDDVLRIAKKKYKSKAIVLSPHWFVPGGPEEYVPVIQREFGWEYPERSYPKKTTNCDLNFIASKLAVKNYGYSVYHIEMSNMIRMGIVTREEALAALQMDFGQEITSGILNKLDVDENAI